MSELISRHGRVMWKTYVIYFSLWTFFRIAWLIVGAIMFIGYLAPRGLCAFGFSFYMWINLIVSTIQLILLGVIQRNIRALLDQAPS
jgi:hypothetical protein